MAGVKTVDGVAGSIVFAEMGIQPEDIPGCPLAAPVV
jgi:hypothetical protein